MIRLKGAVSKFKENTTNVRIISKEIKGDANYFRNRYLDAVPTAKSSKKGFYSEAGLAKAIELFTNDE